MRVVGLLSLSLRRGGFARRKAQAEGRLYSFQAQKLNLISNINLFSPFSLSLSFFLSFFLVLRSLLFFSSLALFLPSAGVLPIRVAARLHYTRPATNNVFRFSH